MLRLTRWTMAHRRLVAIGWIVARGRGVRDLELGRDADREQLLASEHRLAARDGSAQSRFPAQAGDADQIVFHARGGKLGDRGHRAAIGATIGRVATASARHGRREPVRRRGPRDLAGRHDRVCHGDLRPAGRCSCPRPAVNRVIATAQAARSPALAGRARRPGDRAGAAGLARIRDGRRGRRGDPDPADQLRLIRRDGPADR